MAAVYWRPMVTEAHHHKRALCAAATRRVNRIYRVLETGGAHVLRDRDGRPITVAQGRQIVAESITVLGVNVLLPNSLCVEEFRCDEPRRRKLGAA